MTTRMWTVLCPVLPPIGAGWKLVCLSSHRCPRIDAAVLRHGTARALDTLRSMGFGPQGKTALAALGCLPLGTPGWPLSRDCQGTGWLDDVRLTVLRPAGNVGGDALSLPVAVALLLAGAGVPCPAVLAYGALDTGGTIAPPARLALSRQIAAMAEWTAQCPAGTEPPIVLLPAQTWDAGPMDTACGSEAAALRAAGARIMPVATLAGAAQAVGATRLACGWRSAAVKMGAGTLALAILAGGAIS